MIWSEERHRFRGDILTSGEDDIHTGVAWVGG